MYKKLAVAIIHGVGSQGPDFANETIEEITHWIHKIHHKDPRQIVWKSIYWANVLEERQQTYLRDAKREYNLGLLGIREFIVGTIADASSYQQNQNRENSTYKVIHTIVKNDIRDLKNHLDDPKTPLIMLAHSQGGLIMSNYISDIQNNIVDTSDMDEFEKMHFLCGMITYGCIIPIFSFSDSPADPITFPPETLPEELKRKAKWLNFFDSDDVLGFPLKPLSSAYRRTVTEDIAINVGSIGAMWNPACHAGYWTDNNFTKPVAEYIASFL